MIPRECYRWILFRIQADFFGYLVDCYFCTHTGLLFPTNGFPTTGDLPPYAHLVAFYSNGLHLFPSTYKYTLWISLQWTLEKRNYKVMIVLRFFQSTHFVLVAFFLPEWLLLFSRNCNMLSIFTFSRLPFIGVANICFPAQFLAQLQSTHFVGRSEIWSKGVAQFKIWATPHRTG